MYQHVKGIVKVAALPDTYLVLFGDVATTTVCCVYECTKCRPLLIQQTRVSVLIFFLKPGFTCVGSRSTPIFQESDIKFILITCCVWMGMSTRCAKSNAYIGVGYFNGWSTHYLVHANLELVDTPLTNRYMHVRWSACELVFARQAKYMLQLSAEPPVSLLRFFFFAVFNLHSL